MPTKVNPVATNADSREAFRARLARANDWRAQTFGQLGSLIREADPEIVEELKWKKPSNPDGDPVWSHGGIVCVGNDLKRSVRLSFPRGAHVADPAGLFNSRLDSKTTRAIDVFEGVAVDRSAFLKLIRDAVKLNLARSR